MHLYEKGLAEVTDDEKIIIENVYGELGEITVIIND
jgi:hypothetical protein